MFFEKPFIYCTFVSRYLLLICTFLVCVFIIWSFSLWTFFTWRTRHYCFEAKIYCFTPRKFQVYQFASYLLQVHGTYYRWHITCSTFDVTNSMLHISGYTLPFTYHQLRITSSKLTFTHCQLHITQYMLTNNISQLLETKTLISTYFKIRYWDTWTKNVFFKY